MNLVLHWIPQLLVFLLLFGYGISLLWIFIFCVYQGLLAYGAKKYKKTTGPLLTESNFPTVTIQLPLYNEPYVVERLLEAVTALRYPKDKIEFQVLDDSPSPALALSRKLVKSYQEKGLAITLIHRKNREGFKAGALQLGAQKAKGELIAIFDADFTPQKDWLHQTVPHFNTPEIGMVQTRWGHLNKEQSVLTRVMAFALDIHFTLEQKGRFALQHLMAFNGTAGIWRKSCIEDAGNWEGDTLAEDLDLSMRAQMKGWEFKFLHEVVTPGELPLTIAALRSQQFRWNKGGAENFQKLMKSIRLSKQLSKKQKRFAKLHLFSSSLHLPILALIIFSVPLLFVQKKYPEFQSYFQLLGVFFSSTLILLFIYWKVYQQKSAFSIKKLLDYLLHFIQFYGVIMGFSAYNAWAVLQGHWGKKTPFVRTPKFNLSPSKKEVQHAFLKPLPFRALRLEILMTIYLTLGIVYGIFWGSLNSWALLPLLTLALWGFLMHVYLARNPKKAL